MYETLPGKQSGPGLEQFGVQSKCLAQGVLTSLTCSKQTPAVCVLTNRGAAVRGEATDQTGSVWSSDVIPNSKTGRSNALVFKNGGFKPGKARADSSDISM